MADVPRLRAILLRSIVALNLLGVLVFALPLGLAVWRTYRSEAVAGLEREATRTLALASQSDPGQVPAPIDSQVTIGVYDTTGARLGGSGPSEDDDARGALGDGVTRIVTEDGVLAVYVPFTPEGRGPVTIRAAGPLSDLRDRTVRAWAALAGLVLVSMALSAAVGVRRARRLAGPFEHLAEAAHDLRRGAFALAIPSTGVFEGDEVARALEAAAASAAERVDAAHALAEDASHQVRSPIAAARLALESALQVPGADLGRAATTAVSQLDRATEALAEVLTLRRLAPTEIARSPAVPTLQEAVGRWGRVLAAAGRTCRLEAAAVPPGAEVAEAVLRQVLDVLLDNALGHGVGTVMVHARAAGPWLLVDVADDGSLPGVDADLFARGVGHGSGLGLSLAKSLADSVGGRLVLADAAPTRFTLALPCEEAP